MQDLGEFHDGYLEGLLIDGARLDLFLKTSSMEAFILRCTGVLSLKMDGFRQGNILFEVLIREKDEVTVHDIVDLFGFTDEAKALRKLDEISRANPVIVEMNPSYGATCLVLAKDVEILHRRDS